MDIYGEIATYEKRDLNEDDTELTARLLNQYIAEDGIEDKEDKRIERLMRFAESFFTNLELIKQLYEKKGPAGVADWQESLVPAFEWHAKQYPDFYAEILYMVDSPHNMNKWAFCYLVDSAVKAANPKEPFNLSEDEKGYVIDILGFGQNLLQMMAAEKR